MESPPKMPMLYFESKSSTTHQPDFVTCISRFIGKKYQEDPNSYLNEMNELSKLRNAALRQLREIAGCNVLKRYYAQLHSLNNRFKMANEEVGLKFVWIDTFSDRHVSGDINYEMAAIMFNIGALHAELGALDPRKDDSGMKMACTHFQCAAWAFEQIKNNPVEFQSKDLSHDLLSFMYQVTIAQAQECILDKSILDKRKPSIIAKVAAQVVEYYNTALIGLLTGQLTDSTTSVVEVVGSKLFKDWKRFVEIKISYYSALTNLYMGISCEESTDPLVLESKGGERVAWTMAAEDRIKEAEKEVEKMDRVDVMMKDSIIFMKQLIEKKMKSAKNDNDHIYHKPVPSSDKLTAVKGASLVKPIPFSVTDPEIFGADIFGRLIPIEVHEMASVYTDKKDQIVRSMKSKIESKNEELVTFMSSLNLDMDTVSTKNVNVIPDELIEICAAMSIKKDVVETIGEEMKQLEQLSSECGQLIYDIKMQLMKESTTQARFLLTSGIKNSSSSSSHSKMMETFEKEVEKLEERFQKSVDSDVELKKSYEAIIPDIELLLKSSDGASLSSILPTAEIPVSQENIDRLKLLISKVDEMKDQRIMLEKQLRDAIQSDDIASKVISQPESKLDELYEKEIKKFDKHIELLNQNMSAQDNIMTALTTANAEFVPTRRAKVETEKKRIERIKQLTDSYKKYQDVLTHIEKGIYFYRRLLDSVRGINTRINSFITSQEQHRRTPQPLTPGVRSGVRNPVPSRSGVTPGPNVLPASSYAPSSPYVPHPPVNYPPGVNMNQMYSPVVPSTCIPSSYNPVQCNAGPYNTGPSNVVPNHSGLHVTPTPGSHNSFPPAGPHNPTIYNPTQYPPSSTQYNPSPVVYQYNNQPQSMVVNQPPNPIHNNGSTYGHHHAARSGINLMDEPIPSIEDKNVLQPMNPQTSQPHLP